MTGDGLNIELSESDIIDPFDNSRPATLFMNKHEQSTGLQILIPGIVLTALGTLMAVPAIDLGYNEPEDHGLFILTGTVLASGGSIALTFGIKHFRKHARWHRVKMNVRSRSGRIITGYYSKITGTLHRCSSAWGIGFNHCNLNRNIIVNSG
jgi:hypothetical protein